MGDTAPAIATATGAIPELPTVSIAGYEVLTPGTHTGIRGGANAYTRADLDGLAQAHSDLAGVIRPVAKLGHGRQDLLNDVEYPNCGTISRAYVEDDRLKVDLENVPAKVAALIKAGNLPARSAELLFNVQHNGKTYPKVLTGLSFLGESLPAVRGLNDILARYQDAAQPAAIQLSASDTDVIDLAQAPTQSVGGVDHPASDFAYVLDPAKPSGWKLCLTKTAGGDPDPGMVGAAAAALGAGFRGQKVDIPSGDRAAVVAKVRAAWKKANPDKKPAEMPAGIALAALSAGQQAEADAAACDDPKHADLTPALHKKLHQQTKKAALALNLDEVRDAVEDALEDAYPYVQTPYGLPPSGDALDGPSCNIMQLYDDSVIVWDQDHDALWQIPYTYDAAAAAATLGEATRCRLVPETIGGAEMAAATPDALTTGGGSMPAENAGIATDYAQHVAAIKGHLDGITDHLNGLAGKHGVGPARAMHRELSSKVDALQKRLGADSPTEADENAAATAAQGAAMSAPVEETMTDAEIRVLLSLPPEADIKQALISLQAQKVELADYQAVVSERDTLRAERETHLAEKAQAEAVALVDQAVRDTKVLPKMRDWAVSLALKDRASFDVYLGSAPSLWQAGEVGRSGSDLGPAGERPPTEAALSVAQKLGVDPQALADGRTFAQKVADAAKQKQHQSAATGSAPQFARS